MYDYEQTDLQSIVLAKSLPRGLLVSADHISYCIRDPIASSTNRDRQQQCNQSAQVSQICMCTACYKKLHQRNCDVSNGDIGHLTIDFLLVYLILRANAWCEVRRSPAR